MYLKKLFLLKSLSNMDGIATIIARLPMTDTTIENENSELAKQTETQFYEDEKVNSTSLINEEEKYIAK